MDLHQGEFWETEAEEKILITDMTPRHAYNCTRWLERHARNIALADSWNMLHAGSWIRGEQASMDFAAEVDRDDREKEDPVRWIKTTPVWQALNEQAKDREPTTAELFGWED